MPQTCVLLLVTDAAAMCTFIAIYCLLPFNMIDIWFYFQRLSSGFIYTLFN